MRDTLAGLCNQFIVNRDQFKKAFAWESEYLYPVCAAIFTDKGRTADPARLAYCKNILKEQTGIFSNFRGTGKLAMIAMLAVDNNPEVKMQRALQVYGVLKAHFFTSEYLPVASMIVAEMAEPDRYAQIAARTRHIYELMKNDHPFLTSGEDSVFAALLAFSDLTDEQVVAEAEKCYQILKQEFFSGNAVQSLSHVLALGEGAAEEKCRRALDLYRGLKQAGYKYGTSYELGSLGVLALLPAELPEIIHDVIEVDRFLEQQKGYGFFGVGKKQRLMHAGMLVTSDRMGQRDNLTMNSAAIGATISLIAAQQAAMCAAIAASSAAAASASSGGN